MSNVQWGSEEGLATMTNSSDPPKVVNKINLGRRLHLLPKCTNLNGSMIKI